MMLDPRTKPERGIYELDRDHPLSSGLVAMYLFNDGGGPPTINECSPLITTTTAIKTASRIYFDGTTYAASPSYAASSAGVCCNLRIALYNGTQRANARIVEKGANSEWTITTGSSGNGIGVQNQANPTTAMLTNIGDGIFRDIFVSIVSGGLVSIFLNGELQSSASFGTFVASNGNLNIAQYSPSPGSFNGRFWLDHLYVYNGNVIGGNKAAWLAAEPYAMLRELRRISYFVPISTVQRRRLGNSRTGTRTAA